MDDPLDEHILADKRLKTRGNLSTYIFLIKNKFWNKLSASFFRLKMREKEKFTHLHEIWVKTLADEFRGEPILYSLLLSLTVKAIQIIQSVSRI